MTTLDKLIPPDTMAAALDAGHVARRMHPTLPLSIYTYTRAAQYERAWNAATLRCRGLIVDDKTGDIVAWPFPKFFNVAEHDLGHDYAPPLPDAEPFEIYDKVDGSLGIVFWYDGRWRVASKGSFISEQAQWAQAWIDDHDTALLLPRTTYLAEILYPENRIVVDYHGRRDMVLLAAYDADGREIRLSYAADDWGPIGSVVKTWGQLPMTKLLELAAANQTPDGRTASGMDAEGYVVRYASGSRAKAKLAEYVRLHKVLTGITERDIWRMLGMQRFADLAPAQVAKALGCPVAEVTAVADAPAGPLDALLETVPDEFDQWVRTVIGRLNERASDLTGVIHDAYHDIVHLGDDRGVFARAAQANDSPTVRSAMFQMLDGKPVDLLVWKAIRPVAADPFKSDEEG
ncbi:T4 RnlA family RNA ligase [Streptomyces monashensis]|uniref:T4 RnlA family RNA ligase n=1 Tax=Streptomyces monashensis TaxID=1678012 RepID=UPI00340A9FE5